MFLVAGERYGLLSARIAAGHDRRYAFSTIPLVYVLALLETVRAVRRVMRAAHERSAFAAVPFVLPPVLVVLETNFAYGAAVYIQMLDLLERKRARHRDIHEMDIVFATPVYTWDRRIVELRMQLETAKSAAAAAVRSRDALTLSVTEAWRDKGPRVRNLNRQDIIADVRKKLQERGVAQDVREEEEEEVWTVSSIEQEVAEVMRGVMEIVLERNASDQERVDFLKLWASTFQGILARQVQARRAVLVAEARVRRIRDQIAKRETAATAEPENFVQAPLWPKRHDLRPDAVGNEGVVFPAEYWYNAPKSAFGQWTLAIHKVRAFRHWVHMVRGGSRRPMQMIASTPADWARGGPFDTAAPDAGILRQRNGPVDALGPAPFVLRCVYEQWRRLAVTVTPGTGPPPSPPRVVRVEGKQMVAVGEGTAAAVSRDDLWMAFSIGMQWCAQFTQLLPNDRHRTFLVQYMRDLRRTVRRSLRSVLRDAGEEEG